MGIISHISVHSNIATFNSNNNNNSNSYNSSYVTTTPAQVETMDFFDTTTSGDNCSSTTQTGTSSPLAMGSDTTTTTASPIDGYESNSQSNQNSQTIDEIHPIQNNNLSISYDGIPIFIKNNYEKNCTEEEFLRLNDYYATKDSIEHQIGLYNSIIEYNNKELEPLYAKLDEIYARLNLEYVPNQNYSELYAQDPEYNEIMKQVVKLEKEKRECQQALDQLNFQLEHLEVEKIKMFDEYSEFLDGKFQEIKNNMLYYDADTLFKMCINGQTDVFAVFELIHEGAININSQECKWFLAQDGIDELWQSYMYMTDDDRELYHFIYYNMGDEAANKFFDSLRDSINQNIGMANALKKIDLLDKDEIYMIDENGNKVLKDSTVINSISNLLQVDITSLAYGTEQFFRNLSELIYADGIVSPEEYESMYYVQLLEQDSKLLGYSAELHMSIGNMLPSIATSALVSLVMTPAAGGELATLLSSLGTNMTAAEATSWLSQIIGTSVMAVSAAGGSKERALQSGASIWAANLYAILSGSSEGCLQYVLGDIPGLNSDKGLIGIFSEGFEEYLQEYIDAGFRSTILNEQIDLEKLDEDALKSFLMGALSSAYLKGGQQVIKYGNYVLDCNEAINYINNNSDWTSTDLVENSSIDLSLDADYEYVGSDGSVSQINGTQIYQILNSESCYNSFINSLNNGEVYAENMVLALQEYYLENYSSMKTTELANYYSIVSNTSNATTNLDFIDSSLKDQHSVKMLTQDHNAYSEYLKAIESSSQDIISQELSPIHKLYLEIKNGDLVVDGELLSKITSLNNIYENNLPKSYSYVNLNGVTQEFSKDSLKLILSDKSTYNRFIEAVSLGYVDTNSFLEILNKYYEDYSGSFTDSEISNFERIESDIEIGKICTDMYGTSSQNLRLNIETIFESIESIDKFKNSIPSDVYLSLKEIYNFYKSNNGDISGSQVEEYTKKLNDLNDCLRKNGITINGLFSEAQNHFRNELISSISKSKDDIFGSKQTIVKSDSGAEVQMYTVSQDDVEHFNMLIRSSGISDYMRQPDAMKSFVDKLSSKDYLSYSVVDETLCSSFGKNRIVFGYFDVGDSSLLSANTHDGQTNQSRIEPGKYIIKQQYLDIDSFMAGTETGNYNEVVLSNESVLKPDCIFIYDKNPSSDIIEIANNFGLPLVYVEQSSYGPHVEQGVISTAEKTNNWYQNYNQSQLQNQYNQEQSSGSNNGHGVPQGFIDSDDFD